MVIKFLRLEFRKQLPSATFWIMLSLHAFVLILVATNLNTFLKNANIMVNDIPDLDLSLKPILQFPDVWQNVTYIAGYFKIVLALIIVTSVSNEFASGTARQNIIDGLSRRQWLYTKIGLAKVLALFSTLLVLAVCLALGFSQGDQVELAKIFAGIDFLLAYFIELVVYFIYALFLALLLKRTGLSLVLLLAYDFIIEPILSWSVPEQFRSFMPMNAIDNLNKFPFTKYVEAGGQGAISLEQLSWAISYGVLFAFLSYLILKKRDV